MRNSRKLVLALSITAVTLLLQPVFVRAFDLIELVIDVSISLTPDEDYPAVFYPNLLPYTGFTLNNPGNTDILINGSSALKPEGRQTGEEIQDGFALLDNTLLIDVTATEPSGSRAGIRLGTRMDIARASLGREYLRALLIEQQVVRTQDRALRRARAMDLADARMMRFDESGGRWIRAVRAIRAERALNTEQVTRAVSLDDIDFRFRHQTEPDGVLGHYGNFTDTSGNAFVWAVTNVDQRYAVGITIDRDDDGIPNSDDNCVNVTNPNQGNNDTDTLGNACDDDDDNDSVPDTDDNCPLTANTDQLDADGDGIGDVCDEDVDGDGVNDGIDECPGTPPGSVVNGFGCSIAELCPCDNDWKNHGAYVRCNARLSESFLEAGLITEPEKDEIMSEAGQSDCG